MKLVFATHNQNKLNEVKALLKQFNIVSLNEINCIKEIPETANTLEGNAILKANYVTEKYGLNCFADDTGLEVFALDNQPGVYSARYAGEQKSAEANMDKLLSNLKNKKNRKAQFRTVIALNLEEKQYLFEGICKGEIITTKTGEKGFGYDPIFIPEGFDKTFAQMNIDEKSAISHRGLALQKLISFLNNYS